MWVLLLLLSLLCVVAALFGLAQRERKADDTLSVLKNENALEADAPEACNTCAAEGTGCYAERMLRHSVSAEPVYFDDEELDAFCGTPADAYTSEQIALFEDVLQTLRTEEVADWLHALSLRGVELPIALRDEAVMLLQP